METIRAILDGIYDGLAVSGTLILTSAVIMIIHKFMVAN